jgi:ParB/RepB/Spo0J family partition protein
MPQPPTSAPDFVESARRRLAKRRAELRREISERGGADPGKIRSVREQVVELVPLELVVNDPEFVNLRLDPTEEELVELADSIKHEGLKNPVRLIELKDGKFSVRSGFRRTAAVRLLGWEEVPAIVMPSDTPLVDEYWENFLENSARSRLTTYEIAHAARTMRDKFELKAAEIAVRAGYSESYVSNLLRCIDHLPGEVIEQWRGRASIPVDEYVKWSLMRPEEAVAAMRIYLGRRPSPVPPGLTRSGRRNLLRAATSWGLKRMQRVRFAVEACRDLDEDARRLGLLIVDFCSGAREDVPGVYDPRRQTRVYKSRNSPQREDELPYGDIDNYLKTCDSPTRDEGEAGADHPGPEANEDPRPPSEGGPQDPIGIRAKAARDARRRHEGPRDA